VKAFLQATDVVAGVRWAVVASLGPLAPDCASTDLCENPSISKGGLARSLASCLGYLHADQRSTGGVICTAQGSLGSCPCGEQQCLDAPIMRLGVASTLPHGASACSTTCARAGAARARPLHRPRAHGPWAMCHTQECAPAPVQARTRCAQQA